MKQWLKSWGTTTRLSSAYYPQSNGRAEAGVKSLKRCLRGNTGRNGSINTDSVARALLQYRNTPLRDINKSPAELALRQQLRDTMPLPRDRYRVSNHWAHHLRQRERVMSTANAEIKSTYDQKAKELSQLQVGDKVRCQNTRTKKWDRTGTVVELLKHRQYSIRLDGSRRISLRNRRHLLKVVRHNSEVPVKVTPGNNSASNNVTPEYITPQDNIATPSTNSYDQIASPPSPPPQENWIRRSTRQSKKPNWYQA